MRRGALEALTPPPCRKPSGEAALQTVCCGCPAVVSAWRGPGGRRELGTRVGTAHLSPQGYAQAKRPVAGRGPHRCSRQPPRGLVTKGPRAWGGAPRLFHPEGLRRPGARESHRAQPRGGGTGLAHCRLSSV